MKHVLMCCVLLACMNRVSGNGPVAQNSAVTIINNHSDTINVNQNVTDPNGGTLTDNIITPAVHGLTSIVNLNQVLYIPAAGYFGMDSFIFQVCDTLGLCAHATVYINILGTDSPPVAPVYQYAFADTLTDTVLNVLVNDYGPSGEPLTIAAVINPDSGLGYLVIDSPGVKFIHTPQSCGSDTYQVVVCNYSLCDTDIVITNVSCPGNFFLPQGFSPNGDGINDFLVFPQLSYFPNSTLTVFNRYGTVVYLSSDYQNNWNGTDVDTNRPLPDGTYFYTLQVSDGRNFNNYCVINR
jgi:gliding motility-associated-like protein